MNWANRITVLRILLIPLFVTLMIYYGNSVEDKHPKEWQRILGLSVFVIAALSDGIDGYLARRYGQKTRLGTILDPLADKALLVSAIVVLVINQGDAFIRLPPWFAVTVISRDLLLALGALIIQMMVGHVTVRPRMIGKISTVSQMLVLGWTLLQIPAQPAIFWHIRTVLLAVTGVSTIVSGLWYVVDGAKQLGAEGKPDGSQDDKIRNPKPK